MSKNYDEVACKVKKATLNVKSPVDASQLHKELCDFTYNDALANTILEHSRDVIRYPTPKNYYQLYNTLVLVEYLLLNGREELADKFDAHVPLFFKLKNYECGEMADLSEKIREKATRLINLLNNGDLLCKTRVELFQIRNKSLLLTPRVSASDKKQSHMKEIRDILGRTDIATDKQQHVLNLVLDKQDVSVLDTYVDDMAPKHFKRLKALFSLLIETSESINEADDGLRNDWVTKERRAKKKAPTEATNCDASKVNVAKPESCVKTDRYFIIDGSNVAYK